MNNRKYMTFFALSICPLAAGAHAQSDAEMVQAYTVEPGDLLSEISLRLLGDASRYPELVTLNQDTILDADLIYPGQILSVPTGTTAIVQTEPASDPGPDSPPPVEDATPSPRPEVASVTVPPPEEGGPEIGDKIPEADPDTPTSNRFASAAALMAGGYVETFWEDLMPEGEEERLAEIYQRQMMMLYSNGPIAEGSAADQMIQIGTFNTVPELNEVKVRIPGYTVPFEYGADAEISDFLLVPYYGACLHAPPPPPNQTVFVTTDTPIKLKDLAQAVWIEGTLYTQTQESELADAAYTIKMDTIEVYDY